MKTGKSNNTHSFMNTFDWSMIPFILFWLIGMVSVFIGFVLAGFPMKDVIDIIKSECPMLSIGGTTFISGIFTILIYIYSVMIVFGLFFVSVCLQGIIMIKKRGTNHNE